MNIKKIIKEEVETIIEELKFGGRFGHDEIYDEEYEKLKDIFKKMGYTVFDEGKAPGEHEYEHTDAITFKNPIYDFGITIYSDIYESGRISFDLNYSGRHDFKHGGHVWGKKTKSYNSFGAKDALNLRIKCDGLGPEEIAKIKNFIDECEQYYKKVKKGEVEDTTNILVKEQKLRKLIRKEILKEMTGDDYMDMMKDRNDAEFNDMGDTLHNAFKIKPEEENAGEYTVRFPDKKGFFTWKQDSNVVGGRVPKKYKSIVDDLVKKYKLILGMTEYY